MQRDEVAMHCCCFRLLAQCLPSELGQRKTAWDHWPDPSGSAGKVVLRVGVVLAASTGTSVCLLGASSCPIVGWLLGSPVLLGLSETSVPFTVSQ